MLVMEARVDQHLNKFDPNTKHEIHEWFLSDSPYDPAEGLTIKLSYLIFKGKDKIMYLLRKTIKDVEIKWLIYENGEWSIKLDKLRDEFAELKKLEWLNGKITIKPDIEVEDGFARDTTVSFSIKKTSQMGKIFLSYKTTDKDKALVSDFHETLEEFGYSTWFDAKSLKPGTVVGRELLQGIKECHAIVFFITSSFKDDKFLEEEIDYAIKKKIENGDKFAIIPLSFDGAEIPESLAKYKYAAPKTHLEALRIIHQALPE